MYFKHTIKISHVNISNQSENSNVKLIACHSNGDVKNETNNHLASGGLIEVHVPNKLRFIVLTSKNHNVKTVRTFLASGVEYRRCVYVTSQYQVTGHE